jgi:hypothetical protein
MPLTKKGKKIKAAMTKEYGAKKAEKVFYASKNKGVIKGVEKKIKEKVLVVEKNMAHLLKKALIHKVSKLNLEKNLTAYDKLPREQKILVLAGVFDGEGSFGVWSRGKGRAKHLQVKVDTSDADMVARFHEMFGGIFLL